MTEKAGKQHHPPSSPGYWRPLPLGDLLERYGLFSRRVAFLLISWLFLFAICLFSVIYVVPSDWGSLNPTRQAVSFFLFFYPPLLICNLLLFWLGFEWGFIPAYLSTFLIALASEMPVHWAILFGIAVVLGMGIFAIVYYSTRFRYTLSGLSDLAFFVGVAFVASLASSLGSFVWSHTHGLSIEQTLIIWKGWWTGTFLQTVLINAPILFLFGTRVEKLKDRYFNVPERSEVSLKWIYTSIAVVVAILCIFIWSAELLGTLRMEEELNNYPNISTTEILGASRTFELTAWIAIALVVTAGLGGIKLVGNWNKSLRQEVRNRTRQLEESEKQLSQSLEEKETLLSEIHHRVKNNLAIVSAMLELQVHTTDQEETKDLLQNAMSRIQSMAMVHKKLYESESLSDIDLSEYIQQLADSINESISEADSIELKMDMQSIAVDIDQAVPCGLIVNELLVNAFKHAFEDRQSGEVHINLHQKDEERVHLQVSDNGIGLPDDFEINALDSLGMKLIKTLSKQLNADLEAVNKNGQGARFSLEFTRQND